MADGTRGLQGARAASMASDLQFSGSGDDLHAACSYSWISPPRTSRRRIRAVARLVTGAMVPVTPGPDCPHPAFRVSVHPRAARRDFQHLDSCAGEDLVERLGELPGPAADQEPEPASAGGIRSRLSTRRTVEASRTVRCGLGSSRARAASVPSQARDAASHRPAPQESLQVSQLCTVLERYRPSGMIWNLLKYFSAFTGARVTVTNLTNNTYQWLVTPGGSRLPPGQRRRTT
jgi:hypothetical protein